MKRKVISLVLVLALVISGCTTTEDASSNVYEDTTNDGTTNEEATKTSNDTEDASSEESSEAADDEEKVDISAMPVLPDMDYEGLTFKDDGYEIVEYKSLSDGDTANFEVGGMTMACRFLAIDTPETSGSSGIEPWALKAKEFTKNALENADVIILEKDLESDIVDDYGRLLAWVWVDGELLNYQLVEEGLAYVKYLYGDYKYNPTMITLESKVQKTKIKVWGEDDPDYDYDDSVKEVTIKEAKELQPGSSVTIKGVVTNYIGQNAFISDGTASVYIYANKYNYGALDDIGTEIQLTGKIIEYNGLTEISSIVDKKITTLSEGNEVVAAEIVISDINEDIEGDLVSLSGLEIVGVYLNDGGGYDIKVTDGDASFTTVRIDKYLEDYPDPDSLEEGMTIDVVGSVGQYLENYQIMIKDSTSVTIR